MVLRRFKGVRMLDRRLPTKLVWRADLKSAIVLISLVLTCCALGQPTIARADGVNADARVLRYCGIGTRQSNDTPNTGVLAKLIKEDAKSRGEISALMRDLTQTVNPTIKFANSSDSSSILGIAFLVSDESFEEQPFIYPVTGKQKFNNIYRVSLDTIVFNVQDKTVVGLYPWTYQYNESSDKSITPAERATRFKNFFRRPEAPVEGQPPEADNLLTPWKDTIAKLRINEKVKQLAANPIAFDDSAAKLVGNVDKTKTVLTSTLEGLLSNKMLLPIIPNGGAQGTSAGAKITAVMDECFNHEAQQFSLGEPSYRFDIKVDQLQTATVDHAVSRQVNQNGQMVEMNVNQTEVAFGGRFIVRIVQPSQAEGDKVLLELPLKYLSSKRYFGQRTFETEAQYSKLVRSFMNDLLNNITNPKEDWIKDHLSATADKKLKPSDIRKNLNTIIHDKMGVVSAPEGKR